MGNVIYKKGHYWKKVNRTWHIHDYDFPYEALCGKELACPPFTGQETPVQGEPLCSKCQTKIKKLLGIQ